MALLVSQFVSSWTKLIGPCFGFGWEGGGCFRSALNFSSALCRFMPAKQNSILTRSLILIIKLLCSVQPSIETACLALFTEF
jgi:hypothetical protein